MRNRWIALGFAAVSFAAWAAVPAMADNFALHQVHAPIRLGLDVDDHGPPTHTLQGNRWRTALPPGPAHGVVGPLTRQALMAVAPAPVTPTAADQTIADAEAKPQTAPAATAAAKPLQGWVIVVDPGHGGGTGTPVEYAGAKREDDNNYDIAVRVKALLEAEGAAVRLTRDATHTASYQGLSQLASRTQLANDVGADLFLSIHQNDRSNRAAVGVTTYWYGHPRSQYLAGLLEKEIAGTTGLKQDGVTEFGYYVIKHVTMPAVLIEGGFLSNAQEAVRISSSSLHQREAQAVAASVLQYAERYPKGQSDGGSDFTELYADQRMVGALAQDQACARAGGSDVLP